MRSRADKAALAGFVISSAAGIVLSVVVASGRPILALAYSLEYLLVAAWGAAWVVAVVCALRLPVRVIVPLVVVAGIGLRLGSLAGAPVLSNDLYRYSWDGRVQSAGIDPYRYPPDARQLVGLREPWLWPGPAGCARLGHRAGCTQINRPNVRTIYPPVAEGWFTAIYNLAGGVALRYKVWQVAGVLTEVASFALILALLRQWGRDRRWLAVYALCPFAALDIVNDGHVDGLAIALTLGALVALGGPVGSVRKVGDDQARRRWAWRAPAVLGWAGRAGAGRRWVGLGRAGRAGAGRRWVGRGWAGRGWVGRLRASAPGRVLVGPAGRPRLALAGLLVGLATLVKIYPAIALLPVVSMTGLRRSERARAVGWFATVVAVAYLPHLLAVGVKVLGYLPGYLQEEHYAGAGRFLIPGALPLPPALTDAAVAAAAVLACAWVVRRRPDPVTGTTVVVGVALLCATPVQPWYAVLLAALAAAAGLPRWAVVTLAGYPYFFNVILAAHRATLLGRVWYGGAALCVAGAALRARRARSRPPARPGRSAGSVRPAGSSRSFQPAPPPGLEGR